VFPPEIWQCIFSLLPLVSHQKKFACLSRHHYDLATSFVRHAFNFLLGGRDLVCTASLSSGWRTVSLQFFPTDLRHLQWKEFRLSYLLSSTPSHVLTSISSWMHQIHIRLGEGDERIDYSWWHLVDEEMEGPELLVYRLKCPGGIQDLWQSEQGCSLALEGKLVARKFLLPKGYSFAADVDIFCPAHKYSKGPFKRYSTLSSSLERILSLSSQGLSECKLLDNISWEASKTDQEAPLIECRSKEPRSFVLRFKGLQQPLCLVNEFGQLSALMDATILCISIHLCGTEIYFNCWVHSFCPEGVCYELIASNLREVRKSRCVEQYSNGILLEGSESLCDPEEGMLVKLACRFGFFLSSFYNKAPEDGAMMGLWQAGRAMKSFIDRVAEQHLLCVICLKE
jgi:hypothetical protein